MINLLISPFLLSIMIASIKARLLPNLTTIPPTILSPASPSLPEYRCYPQRSPFEFEEALMVDCRQLVRDMANLDRQSRGYKWTFGTADAPGVEKVVPATFSRRSCATHVIDTDSTDAAYDTFTLRYLSQKVARMADLCVAPEPHLGGEGRIGVKQVLAVVVVGIARPSNVTLERLWDDFVVTPGLRAPTQGIEVS